MAGRKIKLSVVLATYNEQENITSCLKAVKDWADEIIVVDGSSKDKTREIAKSFDARVYKTSNKPIFHINKQLALSKASGDWILQLDADEVLTAVLRNEIDKEIKNKEINAYYLARKNYFLGKALKKGGQYPDYVLRLVRKNKAHFPCKSVHEQIEVDGKSAYLKNPLDHFTTPTVKRYWVNANRYTNLTAGKLKDQKIKLGLLSFIKFIFIKPAFHFFALFVRHKGFVDGMRGFLFALFSALHWPIAYFKYWELKRVNK